MFIFRIFSNILAPRRNKFKKLGYDILKENQLISKSLLTRIHDLREVDNLKCAYLKVITVIALCFFQGCELELELEKNSVIFAELEFELETIIF